MEDTLKGQRIGYVRVSSTDQNPQRQLEGVELDRIFTDKASDKDTHRPQLDALLTVILVKCSIYFIFKKTAFYERTCGMWVV